MLTLFVLSVIFGFVLLVAVVVLFMRWSDRRANRYGTSYSSDSSSSSSFDFGSSSSSDSSSFGGGDTGGGGASSDW